MSSFEDSVPLLELASQARRNPDTKMQGVKKNSDMYCPVDVEAVVQDLMDECLQPIEARWSKDRNDLKLVFGDSLNNGAFILRLKELSDITTYESAYPILEAVKSDRLQGCNKRTRQGKRFGQWIVTDVSAAINQVKSSDGPHQINSIGGALQSLGSIHVENSLSRQETSEIEDKQTSLPTPVRDVLVGWSR